MALSKNRLKEKFKQAFSKPSTETNIDRVADEMAQAVIEEVKALEIKYSGGLTSPDGAVTGNIQHTVE